MLAPNKRVFLAVWDLQGNSLSLNSTPPSIVNSKEYNLVTNESQAAWPILFHTASRRTLVFTPKSWVRFNLIHKLHCNVSSFFYHPFLLVFLLSSYYLKVPFFVYTYSTIELKCFQFVTGMSEWLSVQLALLLSHFRVKQFRSAKIISHWFSLIIWTRKNILKVKTNKSDWATQRERTISSK